MSEMHADLKAAQQRILALKHNLLELEEAGKRTAERLIQVERRLSDANGEVLRLGFQLKHHLQLQAERDALFAELAEMKRMTGIAIMCNHVARMERAEAKLAEMEGQEPVAVVCDTYELRWIGRGPIAPIISRHQIKVGDSLYARPVPAEQPVNARLLEALSALLADIEALIGESAGVYGLHLNGDVSPWSELEEGGRFERLSSMSSARDAITSAESAPKAVRLTARECAMATSKSAHVRSDDMLEIARAVESATLRKNGIEVAE